MQNFVCLSRDMHILGEGFHNFLLNPRLIYDPKMVKDHKKQIPAPDREIASTISIHTYRFHSFCLSYPQDTLMCVIPWTHYTILAFWILATFQVFHLWWHHSPFALLLFWISVSLFCAVEIQKPHGRGGVMCFYILSIELISLV